MPYNYINADPICNYLYIKWSSKLIAISNENSFFSCNI